MVCQWVLKSGPNQGSNCTGKVTPGNVMCAKHRKKKADNKLPAFIEEFVKSRPAKNISQAPEVDDTPPALEPHSENEDVANPEEFESEPDMESEPHSETPEEPAPPQIQLPPPKIRQPIPSTSKEVFVLSGRRPLPSEPSQESEEETRTEPSFDEEDEYNTSEAGDAFREPRPTARELNEQIESDNEAEFKAQIELRCLIKDYPEVSDLIPPDILESDVPVQLKLKGVKDILNSQRGFIMAKSGIAGVTQVIEGVSASKGLDITGFSDAVCSDRECNRLLRLIAIKHEDKLDKVEPELALAFAIGGIGFKQYSENKKGVRRLTSPEGQPGDEELPSTMTFREQRENRRGAAKRAKEDAFEMLRKSAEQEIPTSYRSQSE